MHQSEAPIGWRSAVRSNGVRRGRSVLELRRTADRRGISHVTCWSTASRWSYGSGAQGPGRAATRAQRVPGDRGAEADADGQRARVVGGRRVPSPPRSSRHSRRRHPRVPGRAMRRRAVPWRRCPSPARRAAPLRQVGGLRAGGRPVPGVRSSARPGRVRRACPRLNRPSRTGDLAVQGPILATTTGPSTTTPLHIASSPATR